MDYGKTKLSQWTNALRKDLETNLRSVQGPGSFAHFEPLGNVPDPGLDIDGMRTIGLPLSDVDAQRIVAASHQAPFGKGTETIIDHSVRKTWELSPTEFSLTNWTAWEAFINSVVKHVVKKLGVDKPGVRADLYKLLLYEEGAMFKPHQDSEKAPGMFGTLVICLPSRHEGGEVHVTHAGRELVLETSKYSDSNYSTLAWYADVVHEVKPIISGRRLVLTYNLIQTNPECNTRVAANGPENISWLKSHLSEWKSGLSDKDKGAPETLAYLLEHQYTDASLSYNALKGQDHKVVSHLKEACKEAGFIIYLANCERQLKGGCDEDDAYDKRYGRSRSRWYDDDDDEDEDDEPENNGGHHELIEIYERSMDLKYVVELDGTHIPVRVDWAHRLDYDEAHIIQTDPFRGREPDDEDYSGFTGNEGVSATHFYRSTVAIIMPRRSRIPFLLRNYGSTFTDAVPEVNLWLDRLFEVMSSNPNSVSLREAREEAEEICRMVITDTQSWKAKKQNYPSWNRPSAPFPSAVLHRVLKAAVELDKIALLKNALKSCEGELPVPLYRDLGVMLGRYKYELRQETSSELQHVKGFASRFKALLNIADGFGEIHGDNQNSSESLSAFFTQELQLAVDSMPFTSTADGLSLVSVAQLDFGEPGELLNIVVASVKKNTRSTPMAVAFLIGMMDAISTGKISESDVHLIFKDIVKDVIQYWNLMTWVPSLDVISNKRLQLSYGYGKPSRTIGNGIKISPEMASALKEAQNVAALLRHCLLLGLRTELDQVLVKITGQMRTLPMDAFRSLLVPLLKHLANICSRDEISTFHVLFQEILIRYVTVYIQTEPQPPTDWRREKKGCGCKDCAVLDRFILDPNAPTSSFTMGEHRRRHLCDRVNGINGSTARSTARHQIPEYIEKNDTNGGNGSTHTLHLTKTSRKYEADMKVWQRRVDAGIRYIRSIGSEELMKSLLGDVFTSIWSLDARGLTTRALGGSASTSTNLHGITLPPLGTAGPSRVNQATDVEQLSPITNRKRSAVVDLTIDSD